MSPCSTSLVMAASERCIGFAKAISYGNECDLGPFEFLPYLARDPRTRVIAVYVEGTRRPAEFRQALAEAAAIKPVVLLKGGTTAVGSRVPATCTGLGKAMLAFSPGPVVRAVVEQGMERRTPYSITESGRMVSELQRIRKNGVAVDREESTVGITCVAAPVITGAHTIAAVSVSGPTTNFDEQNYGRLVQWAARRIAIDLGADAAASTAGF